MHGPHFGTRSRVYSIRFCHLFSHMQINCVLSAEACGEKIIVTNCGTCFIKVGCARKVW